MLTGLFLLLQENNLLYLILSAIFFVLSYFTKQNSLIFFVFVFCFIFLENRRFALIFLIIFGICIVVITQFFQSINDGWYNYYTLILSNFLDKKLNKIFTFWINDLIKNFPIGVLSIIILIFINKIFSNVLRKRYYLILLGLIIISYLPRLLIGGYENALIPAFIGISVFSAISFKYINNLLPKDFHKFLYLSIIIQLLVLYYPVKPQIPSVNDKTKGELLIDKITKFNGEVFFSDHPYYLILAGKKPQAHTMAISDFINSNTNLEYRNKLLNDFSGRIKSKKYEALIFDRDDFLLKIFFKEINENYSLIDNNLTGNYFIPGTGGTNKPTFLYVRK